MTIEACLESLLSQEAAPGEIIVVDSSSDGTSGIVTRQFPQVKLRQKKKPSFPGPARNYGASKANGSIIAFIDADCVAEPDWTRRIVAWHNQGHQVVGGAITVGNPANPVAWAGHLSEFREFRPIGEPRPVPHIPTCNISYRKKLIDETGGFPDSYYPQEDLLFNYMLNQKGLQIWFDPEMQVRHFCRERLPDFLSHQHRIGRVTHSTLLRIELPGSTVARRAWLAWMVAPLLGLVKFLRTVPLLHARSAQFQTCPTLSYGSQRFIRLKILALLVLGCLWWGRGFAAGALKGLSGIHGWNDPDEPFFRLFPTIHEGSKYK